MEPNALTVELAKRASFSFGSKTRRHHRNKRSKTIASGMNRLRMRPMAPHERIADTRRRRAFLEFRNQSSAALGGHMLEGADIDAANPHDVALNVVSATQPAESSSPFKWHAGSGKSPKQPSKRVSKPLLEAATAGGISSELHWQPRRCPCSSRAQYQHGGVRPAFNLFISDHQDLKLCSNCRAMIYWFLNVRPAW